VRVVNAGKSAARELTLGYDAWPENLDDVAVTVRQATIAITTKTPVNTPVARVDQAER
jgi:hypothetical protein